MTTQPSIAINTTEIGEAGERVVFLHGLFGQGRNFNQVAKALQPELRSLLVDLPNHGRSGWTEHFSYVEIADLVAAHLRDGYAAGDRVHVVGHSMGGKVAMVLALRHPDLVERLVVADISPVDGQETGEFAYLLDTLAGLDLDDVARRADADERLREPIPDDRVRGFLLQNLRRSGDGFDWQANLTLLRRELPEVSGFPQIETTFDRPVLWVAGERSDYVKREYADDMRRLFPRTTLLTVKNSGHWVHSEQPESFASALRAFLLSRG